MENHKYSFPKYFLTSWQLRFPDEGTRIKFLLVWMIINFISRKAVISKRTGLIRIFWAAFTALLKDVTLGYWELVLATFSAASLEKLTRSDNCIESHEKWKPIKILKLIFCRIFFICKSCNVNISIHAYICVYMQICVLTFIFLAGFVVVVPVAIVKLENNLAENDNNSRITVSGVLMEST